MGLLIFVLDYGLLFWAEKRVPSGIAAVMMATIPAFMALAEITLLGTQRLTVRLAAALLIGLAGVMVLASPSLNLGGAAIDTAGAVALLVAAMSFALGSVLSRKLPLPESKVMSSGAQMLAGGVLLAATSMALGEFHNFHPGQVSRAGWIAFVYLIVAGSIIGFTAYVWLLRRESPTKVGTYAYVNPVVAVGLGYFLGGEAVDRRVVVGAVLVMISVVMITLTRVKSERAGAERTEEAT